MYLKEKYES
jgi:hypothetical protein